MNAVHASHAWLKNVPGIHCGVLPATPMGDLVLEDGVLSVRVLNIEENGWFLTKNDFFFVIVNIRQKASSTV